MNKFDRDLEILSAKLNKDTDIESRKKLDILKDKLIRMHDENVVKINHSVMEMVCAKHLILKGYELDIERPINGLVCDIYGVKGLGSHIVEIETGFIPPSHALDPTNYRKSRIASKIIRYGNHSEKFALGVPPYYLLQIPEILVKPPRARKKEDLKYLKTFRTHRQVEILTKFEAAPPVFLPEEVLQKVIDGLIRNAVENTPDEGKIEIAVEKKGEGSQLVVKDFGIGIPEEAKSRILEGYFTTQDIMNYSTKHPFDFGAGGKGADLLRMKIFSERYDFKIGLDSTRCRHIPMEKDICPGRISRCKFCKEPNDCYGSGSTVVTVTFPPPPK